jgi:hypothetical protein
VFGVGKVPCGPGCCKSVLCAPLAVCCASAMHRCAPVVQWLCIASVTVYTSNSDAHKVLFSCSSTKILWSFHAQVTVISN